MNGPLDVPRWSFWALLRFWGGVAFQTIARRSLPRVVESRLRGRALAVAGAEHVPRDGGFVFCVNHYHAGLTLDVVSATIVAAARTRPRVRSECAIVVGHRFRPTSRWATRWLRWTAGRFFARWSAHVLRIRTGDSGTRGVAALRAWRTRAKGAPTLVFPEGVAGRELGSMRAGVGRWLCGLDVPVVPVGVWWGGTGWNVAFGRPIAWSARRDLRDLQLGLAMAELLPQELAPSWSDVLERWRAAHRASAHAAAAAAAPAAPAPESAQGGVELGPGRHDPRRRSRRREDARAGAAEPELGA